MENDVSIEKSEPGHMFDVILEIDSQPVSRLSGDGLVCATPTGSTAYSLSAGGPILHPRVFGIVLAPIAPHALSNRPIVLPGDAEISIEIAGGKDVSVNFDMQSMTTLQTGDKILVQQSEKTVTLLHPLGHSDYKTLRQKLHWNEYPSSF